MSEERRENLKSRLELLYQELDESYSQLNTTLSETDALLLRRRITQIEREIVSLEQEIASYVPKDHPTRYFFPIFGSLAIILIFNIFVVFLLFSPVLFAPVPQSAPSTPTFTITEIQISPTSTWPLPSIAPTHTATLSSAPSETTTPTETITPTPTPIEVASVNITSASGSIIGSGRVFVYQEERVQYPNSTRIELYLGFDKWRITPTPSGPITEIPVTPGRPVPTISNLATPPFEPTPSYQEQIDEIYQRMGASLFCSEASFTGCNSSHDVERARTININGETWSWILRPQENIRGTQDLTLYLWAVERIDEGSEQAEEVWRRNIRLRVQDDNNFLADNFPGLLDNATEIFIALLGAGAFSGILYRLNRWRKNRLSRE